MRRGAARIGAALLLAGSALPARAAPFDSYQLIQWQERSPAQFDGLRQLGFTGTKLTGSGGQMDPARLAIERASGLPWYVENIATDFYAPYHRYRPGQAVTVLFDAAKDRLRTDPGDRSVFIRDPGLSDPVWLARIEDRLARVVGAVKQDRPLFYNLADEAGIGDLAAAWDADVSPSSLAGMRSWLRSRYPDLAALNAEWGADFASWDEVVPELTTEAMRRTDDNYASWSDFKAWMDTAFARALRSGTDAVHQADPAGLAGLEGAQLPGWGGYDYALLAPSVDVMEVFTAADALELAQAFNPGLITLRTSFGDGPGDRHDAWRHVLRGGRGTIVWDDPESVQGPDGSALPRGRQLARIAASIRAVSPAILGAQPDCDPVAVLVSQESFRLRWLLDHRTTGAAWIERSSGREYEANDWSLARSQVLRRLGELAIQPRILSSAMLEAGALQQAGVRVLILPHAIALSRAETDTIAAFVRAGGTVLADTMPGLFDEHGKILPKPALSGLVHLPEAMMLGEAPDAPGSLDAVAAELEAAGVRPRATLRDANGERQAGVDARWLRKGGRLTLALQTVHPWPAGATVQLTLSAPATMRDLRRPAPPDTTGQLAIALDPVEPTLLDVAPR